LNRDFDLISGGGGGKFISGSKFGKTDIFIAGFGGFTGRSPKPPLFIFKT